MKQKLGFRAGAALLALCMLLCGCTQGTVQPAVPSAPQTTAHFSLIEEEPGGGETSAPEEPSAAPEESPVPTPSPAPTPTPAPTPKPTKKPTPTPKATESPVREDGIYSERDEVALYLHLFGHLPDNYITKSEAQKLGWPGGRLDDYAYGKCIGGDYFGNYEGLLPSKRGRKYYECDIGTLHRRSRGAKRIIYSNDGLIYYTDDHYESYQLLYGEE